MGEGEDLGIGGWFGENGLPSARSGASGAGCAAVGAVQHGIHQIVDGVNFRKLGFLDAAAESFFQAA